MNEASPRVEPPPPASRPLTGILILLGAVACFACMDASAKWLNRDLRPLQIAGVRYVVSLLAVLVFLRPARTPGVFRAKRPGLQIARGMGLVGATLGVFASLRFLPLTQLTAIMFSVPLMTAVLAGPVLGEKLGPRRLVSVLVGFVGVLVITRPFAGEVSFALLFAAGAALSNAFYVLTTRALAAHDRPETTLFYTCLVGTLVVSPALFWEWQMPSTPMVWAVMIGLGCIGALGHGLLILAHRHAPASVLAPFFYLQIVGALFFALTVFDEVPDGWTLLGAAIVIGSGLYLLHRERVRNAPPSTDVPV